MTGWLRESARVVALEAETVWVEAQRSSACGRCSARAGCGHGALSGILGEQTGRVRARSGTALSASDCAIGDEVIIEVPESSVLRGSSLLYGLPLLMATLVSLSLSRWGDLWAALGFLSGLLISFAILGGVARRAGSGLPGYEEPRLAQKVSSHSQSFAPIS